MSFSLTELRLPSPRASDLIGAWHIVRTTFPMWRSGKNSRPSLNYAAVPDDPTKLEDLVVYERGGSTKRIRGIDRQDPELPCHFVWRGHGLLALLRSDWYVVDLAIDDGCMAIYFSKTLFTPAGLDVATRSPTPDHALVEACVDRIRAAAILRPHVDALVEIDQDRGQRLSR